MNISKNILEVDREKYVVRLNGSELNFPKKEFELIYLLASVPGRVFTRKEIFRNIWKKDVDNHNTRTIDVHIRKIREKLSGISIITIKGVGYKLSSK